MRNPLLTIILTALASLSLTACGGTALPGAADGGGDPNGFNKPDDPKNPGSLTGTALRSGAPAAGVVAHLFDEATGAKVVTHTDQAGVFRFEVSPAHYKLVLNDARGQGSLETFIVFGGGVNDIGPLELQPLEGVPNIVDMVGIGFEERLTKKAGDYKYPVFNADRSFVYAARKLGGDSSYDVLKISIPAGAETVLSAKQDLYFNTTQPLELLSDQVLGVWEMRLDAATGYTTESLAFLNAATGAELAVEPWYKLGGYFAEGGMLYVLEAQSSRVVGSTIFGDMHQYLYAMARIDPATGARTQGATLNYVGWASNFHLSQHDAQQLVVIPGRDCDMQYAQQHPSECSSPFPGNPGLVPTLFRVALASMTDVEVTSVTSADQGMLSADGASLYVLGAGANGTTTTLSRITLATGATSTVVSRACATEWCMSAPYPGIAKSPVADEILVQVSSPTGTTPAQKGFERIVLATGAATRLPLDQTIDGLAYSLCTLNSYGSTSCAASFLASGAPRVTDLFTATTGEHWALVTDFPAAGAVARRFAIGASDGLPAILTSANGAAETVVLRDLATGFTQLWSGAPGAAAAAMTPETFLTANHHDGALSTDGSTLFYFTRDPISGYEQLFRVALGQP